jgi:ATP-dependent DNA ligase
MPLARFDAPLEHTDWIFEPKLDGFRAVAYVEGGDRLLSRLPPEQQRPVHHQIELRI